MKSVFYLAGIFMTLSFFSCRQLSPPEFVGAENIKIGIKNIMAPTLAADIQLYNPNKANLTFKSGNLDIYVENRLLGHTTLDSTIHIKKLDTFRIPILVQVNWSNMISNAMALSLKDSVLIRLEGKIKIGKSGVFITRPIRYEQKEKLDLL